MAKRILLGEELLLTFSDCKSNILNNSAALTKILIKSAKEANATVINHATSKYTPFGITVAVILAESHLILHSWPECNTILINLFSCGHSMRPKNAITYMKKQFRPCNVTSRKISRYYRC